MTIKPITTTLIVINLIIFIIINVNPTFHKYILLLFGLNDFTYKYFYTIITSMFLHANIMHIAFNMLALYQLGNIIENNFSKSRYLLTYFLSGLAGGIFSIIYMKIFNYNINVIGASGAIFGLYAYYSFIYNKMNEFYINVILFHALIFLTGMNIAWYAHLGGITIGLLSAYQFKKSNKNLYFL